MTGFKKERGVSPKLRLNPIKPPLAVVQTNQMNHWHTFSILWLAGFRSVTFLLRLTKFFSTITMWKRSVALALSLFFLLLCESIRNVCWIRGCYRYWFGYYVSLIKACYIHHTRLHTLLIYSYSCVGVWESERVEIIANEQGNRTTPSYVAFSDKERLVGDAAKNQAAMNPKNTVFDAKRLIGRRFDDPDVKADMKNWPFTVVEQNENPFIQVEFEGETKTYSPQGKRLKNFIGVLWLTNY